MTPEEKAVIDKLGHVELAWLWRFAPSGHRYFVGDTPESQYYHRRFKELGGMTPAISKQIGWEK